MKEKKKKSCSLFCATGKPWIISVKNIAWKPGHPLSEKQQ